MEEPFAAPEHHGPEEFPGGLSFAGRVVDFKIVTGIAGNVAHASFRRSSTLPLGLFSRTRTGRRFSSRSLGKTPAFNSDDLPSPDLAVNNQQT